jgi:hypothetical protein
VKQVEGKCGGILHPSGMHWFAGVDPVVSLTLNHRLVRFDASGI